MATRYRFSRPARADLLDAIAALPGLGATTPAGEARVELAPDGLACYVRCEPEQFDAVASAVAAYSPAAYDAAAATAAQQDSDDIGKVRAAYQALRANADALRADAATLTAMTTAITAAQTKARLIQIENMQADANDALASLARYVGRRLG